MSGVPGGALSRSPRTAPVIALESNVSSARSGSMAPRSTPMLPDRCARRGLGAEPAEVLRRLRLAPRPRYRPRPVRAPGRSGCPRGGGRSSPLGRGRRYTTLRPAASARRERDHEDALGMTSGELAAPLRRPGLEQQRRALRRRLAQMRPGHLVVRPDVVDGVHLGRVGVHAPGAVGDDRVVLPAGLPQLVGDLEVLVGPGRSARRGTAAHRGRGWRAAFGRYDVTMFQPPGPW